jgi:hypothetical protein
MAKPSTAALTTALVAVVAVGVAVVAARSPSTDSGDSQTQAQPVADPTITLDPVRKVRPVEPVRLTGEVENVDDETTVTLQRRADGQWVTVAQDRRLDGGSFAFLHRFAKPTTVTLRTAAQRQGETVAVSAARKVTVLPPTGKGSERLPDLGARKLTDCPPSEEPCFWIEEVEGKKWLRFPVTAVNVGDGPLEMQGHRSSTTSSDWIATRRIYHANGGVHAEAVPGVTFFYARDEHDHWHIKDFHTYQILDDGGTVRRGEKEAFCFEDNTTYRDWSQRPAEYPQVPQDAVYTHEASCGEGNDLAIDIVHGLSSGWGDTYPTTLPDQGVDITGLADGVYTVRVRVDTYGFVRESNERNNTATVVVRIKGDEVTPDPSTATGL